MRAVTVISSPNGTKEDGLSPTSGSRQLFQMMQSQCIRVVSVEPLDTVLQNSHKGSLETKESLHMASFHGNQTCGLLVA